MPLLPTRQPIQLSIADDSEPEDTNTLNTLRWYTTCLCLRTSSIRLPEDAPTDFYTDNTTYDASLSPRDALRNILSPQSEERESVTGHHIQKTRIVNPFGTSPSDHNQFVDFHASLISQVEEAEELSDHRISALFSDQTKIDAAMCDLSIATTGIADQTQCDQELVDVSGSSSDTCVNTAILRDMKASEQTNKEESPLDDVTQCIPLATGNDYHDTEHPLGRMSEDLVEYMKSTDSCSLSTAENQQSRSTTATDLEAETRDDKTTYPMNSNEWDAYEHKTAENPEITRSTLPAQQDFPIAALTRAPFARYESSPNPMDPQRYPHTKDTSTEMSDHQDDTQTTSTRRSSMAAVAHSLLGDKLDDLTGKLAYIKKNIIMSMDMDDEDDSWDEGTSPNPVSDQGAQRRPSTDPLSSFLFGARQTDDNQSSEVDQHGNERADLAKPFMQVGSSIMRFVDQIGGREESRSFSPSSFFASLAGPSSPPRESDNGVVQHRGSAQTLGRDSRATARHVISISEASEDDPADSEEEELFDFSKVITMGKHMRTYSETTIDNSLRLLSQAVDRLKNAQKQDSLPEYPDSPTIAHDTYSPEHHLPDTKLL
ncbi:uncharacterized protein BYT42DRAFT_643679 [Radiomyces spectabilis]|uniref:uncharacterized protein n=1 Tax=Radiomyces spectabilis TaxID=64574 RepID=UPI00221E9047|nr:uncharacterized protein BYT42DRAFT_643679 [Radiomyces spectabilis]KAI8384947.1 hypothetical protein BYT42DRAFT_643679 [Radiomyces spectabilis]